MIALEKTASTHQVLNALYEGHANPEDALKTLENPAAFKGFKKARFIRIRMKLPNESKKLNLFLRSLFALPIPISMARFFLNIAGKHAPGAVQKTAKHLDAIDEAKREEVKQKIHASSAEIEAIDFQEIGRYLRYARGTRIDIITSDAIINITIR